jgi:hypothetical protein
MGGRDFFAFCTSLRPMELKALGNLSQVRHMPAGETVYGVGDAGDALYIINRGAIEITCEPQKSTGAATYLSRGDVFGALELLTDTTRKHRARTCEDVSLQCFHRDAFPELLQHVPSFFRYLCDQLAFALVHARDIAVPQTHRLELSGSLANFDLVTIYQTIVNSSQTGELTIFRNNGEVLAAFSFDQGHPSGGHFEHLRGEEAFSQLFQTAELRGTFSFSSDKAASIHVVEPAWTGRTTDELLISALQSRDELDALRRTLPDTTARLEPQRKHLDLQAASCSETGPLIGQIWERSCSRPTALGDLYPQFLVSELKIYRVVEHLVKTGHIALTACDCAEDVMPQQVA